VTCALCAEPFCSTCSTVNYDLREERDVCIACESTISR